MTEAKREETRRRLAHYNTLIGWRTEQAIKKYLEQYLDGKIDAISFIRMLSGMFNPDHAMTILSLICTITRHEQGDIDTETFKAIWLKEPEKKEEENEEIH